MQPNQIIVSGGVIAKKKTNGKYSWLLVKLSEEGDWEIPKVTVRKGESSVRASIRMAAEQGGMNARVLDEAGRFTGTAIFNDRTIPKRILYYLMVQRSGGETLGFVDADWFEYKKAIRLVSSKREQGIIKVAKEELASWIKGHEILPEVDEFPLEEVETK